MEPMKNLCGLIPESLHKRLMEGKSPEMTNGEYLTKILTTYLDQPAVSAHNFRKKRAFFVKGATVAKKCINKSRTIRKKGRPALHFWCCLKGARQCVFAHVPCQKDG